MYRCAFSPESCCSPRRSRKNTDFQHFSQEEKSREQPGLNCSQESESLFYILFWEKSLPIPPASQGALLLSRLRGLLDSIALVKQGTEHSPFTISTLFSGGTRADLKQSGSGNQSCHLSPGRWKEPAEHSGMCAQPGCLYAASALQTIFFSGAEDLNVCSSVSR